MTTLPPNPYGNTCQITLRLPWEVAEALVKHWPEIIAPIQMALEARKEEARQQPKVRALLDKECEDNKAEWAALAQHCEKEIARRSNKPGQRRQIVKQLAGELKVSAFFIESICRVYNSERRQEGLNSRKAQIIRLHFAGWTNRQIAKHVKLAPETVSRILGNEADLVKSLRQSLPDYERLKGAVKDSEAVQ